MGVKLVRQVLDRWAPALPPHLTTALVRMALTAQDDGDPPTYWAGNRPIALALGPRPHAADPDSAAEQAADRAVAHLVKLGAIRRTRRGGVKGQTAEYALDLFGEHVPVGTQDLGAVIHR